MKVCLLYLKETVSVDMRYEIFKSPEIVIVQSLVDTHNRRS